MVEVTPTVINREQARRWLILAEYLANHRQPKAGETGVAFDMAIIYGQFSSDSFVHKKHSCGTAACAAGHMACIPEFQKLGISANRGTEGACDLVETGLFLHGRAASIFEVTRDRLFTTPANEHCFPELVRLIFFSQYEATAQDKAEAIYALIYGLYPDMMPAKQAQRVPQIGDRVTCKIAVEAYYSGYGVMPENTFRAGALGTVKSIAPKVVIASGPGLDGASDFLVVDFEGRCAKDVRRVGLNYCNAIVVSVTPPEDKSCASKSKLATSS